MLTASHCFVMSSLALGPVVHRASARVQPAVVHFATHQNDIIAKCNVRAVTRYRNHLILNCFLSVNTWHAECNVPWYEFPFRKNSNEGFLMNMTLSLLNAAALVALVAFHFQDDGSKTESVAVQAQPHYLMKQPPRIAMMSEQRSQTLLATDVDEAVDVDRSQRWVF